VVPARRVLTMGAVTSALGRLKTNLYRTLSRVGSRPAYVAPGHYYSPVPSLADVRAREDVIFGRFPRELPGIDLNEAGQLRLLDAFCAYYKEQPFGPEKRPGLRYYFENEAYSYSDAICLYCMIRHLKPRRIIEVGSGFSSAAILDANELFFGGSIRCTFIEPYPDRLRLLFRPDDWKASDVAVKRLQEVDRALFQELDANDILFIDSSHVSKVDSDVNLLYLDILPRLRRGVVVHSHDIFYPFEYPKEWIYEGRSWNEAYLLRAFLAFNGAFEVLFCNTFLEHFHRERFVRDMPLCLKNPGGSLWTRRK
jgi:hypothetical protein